MGPWLYPGLNLYKDEIKYPSDRYPIQSGYHRTVNKYKKSQ